jgi:hypothetical protein
VGFVREHDCPADHSNKLSLHRTLPSAHCSERQREVHGHIDATAVLIRGKPDIREESDTDYQRAVGPSGGYKRAALPALVLKEAPSFGRKAGR